MERVNGKFKQIFVKVFEQAEQWQELHTETCNLILTLIKSLSCWDILSSSNNSDNNTSSLGIFQHFPQTTLLIQGYYVKDLESLQNQIQQQVEKYETICKQISVIQLDAFHYYQQTESSLSNLLERKRDNNSPFNFTIINDYLTFIQESEMMFQNECIRISEILQNVKYLNCNVNDLEDIFRKLSNYEYFDISKIISSLDLVEKQLMKDKMNK
ncbi:hypothetical protein ABK040_001179 [Willaertia magna]